MTTTSTDRSTDQPTAPWTIGWFEDSIRTALNGGEPDYRVYQNALQSTQQAIQAQRVDGIALATLNQAWKNITGSAPPLLLTEAIADPQEKTVRIIEFLKRERILNESGGLLGTEEDARVKIKEYIQRVLHDNPQEEREKIHQRLYHACWKIKSNSKLKKLFSQVWDDELQTKVGIIRFLQRKSILNESKELLGTEEDARVKIKEYIQRVLHDNPQEERGKIYQRLYHACWESKSKLKKLFSQVWDEIQGKELTICEQLQKEGILSKEENRELKFLIDNDIAIQKILELRQKDEMQAPGEKTNQRWRDFLRIYRRRLPQDVVEGIEVVITSKQKRGFDDPLTAAKRGHTDDGTFAQQQEMPVNDPAGPAFGEPVPRGGLGFDETGELLPLEERGWPEIPHGAPENPFFDPFGELQ